MTTHYEAVIGLEVHAQLMTRTKIFCGCENRFGAPPNTLVCPVCLGMPGVLPVLNERAVELAIRAGNALGCDIRSRSVFARKNYFYPDLPKGYQISQFDQPVCEGGHVPLGDGRSIELTRIHLEEDAGKSFHPEGGGEHSLVDLNRCGVPLIEIVSEPVIRSAEDAYSYLVNLKRILEYTEVCDGNMEQGSLRCDANVSLRPVGTTTLGTKTELKNLNSFRATRLGIEAEIARQEKILTGGGTIRQETMQWDADRGVPVPMRSKEEAHDYRYFPEPDLPPLLLSQEKLRAVRDAMPELPDAKRERFQTEYGLREYDAGVLTDSAQLARFFETVVKHFPHADRAANFLMGPYLRLQKEQEGDDLLPVEPEALAQLLALEKGGAVSPAAGRQVFEAMVRTGKAPADLVKELGLEQISDDGALQTVVDEVLAANPEQVAEFLGGKEKVLGFLMGQVMKATRGKGNPGVLTPMLRASLEAKRG